MTLSEVARAKGRLSAEQLKSVPCMTVGDWAKKGRPAGVRLFINTFRGLEEVVGLRWPETDPWVVCGKGLDAHSYCVHYVVPLYVEGSAETEN